MASPVVASFGVAADTNATAVPVPSGVVSGSLVVITGTGYSATVPTTASLSFPGFTIKSVESVAVPVYSGYFYTFRAHKYATGADSGSYTFTGTQLVGAQSARITGGATSGDPWAADAVQSVFNGSTAVTAYTIPSFTPAGNNSLLLYAAGCDDAWSSVPAGWTRMVTVNSGEQGYLAQAVAAPTGNLTWTAAAASVGLVSVYTLRAATTRVTKTLATAWNTRGRVTKTQATAWNVAGTLSRVTKTVSTAWNVRQRVTKAQQTSWNVLGNFKYATAVSANKRYFVDQNGDPFLPMLECVWFFAGHSPTERAAYYTRRSAQGFNTIEMAPSAGNDLTSTTYDGIVWYDATKPYSLSTAWLARLRDVIDEANAHGFTVLLNLGYNWQDFPNWNTGSGTGPTGLASLLYSYLAGRQIIWGLGVDYVSSDWATYNVNVVAIANAIKAQFPGALTSVQNYHSQIASDNTGVTSILDYEMPYEYAACYDTVLRAYNANYGPTVHIESEFFGENNQGGPDTTLVTLVRQQNWTYTRGGIGGYLYGHTSIWKERDPAFTTALASGSSDAVAYSYAAVKSMPWWKLVPDSSNTFLTSGAGTKPTSGTMTGDHGDNPVDPLESTYATAAVAPDKSAALIYLPQGRTIGINTSKLGTNPVITWYPVDSGGTPTVGTFGASMTPPDTTNGWLGVITADATTRVTKTLATAWKVGARVTKTQATAWGVRGRVTKTQATSWRVLNRVTKAQGTAWNDLNRVTKTQPTQWGTLARVTKTAQTAWSLAARITKTQMTTWNIAGVNQRVTKTLSVAWNVAQRITVSRQTTWNVRQRVTKAQATSWNDLNRLTTSQPVAWDVLARVNKTQATAWNVASSTIRVTKSQAVSWAVQARVTKNVATRWNVDSERPIQPWPAQLLLFDANVSITIEDMNNSLTLDAA